MTASEHVSTPVGWAFLSPDGFIKTALSFLRVSNFAAVSLVAVLWLSLARDISADVPQDAPYTISCKDSIVVRKPTNVIISNHTNDEIIVCVTLQLRIEGDWRHVQTSIFDEVDFYAKSGLAKRIKGKMKFEYLWNPAKEILPLIKNRVAVGRLQAHIIYGKNEGEETTVYSSPIEILSK